MTDEKQNPESQERSLIPIGERGLVVTDHEELWRYAEKVSKATVCPDAFRGRPADVFMVMAFGMEQGMGQMTALNTFISVHGRIAIPGEAAMAKIQGSPDCEWFEYGWEGQPGTDEYHAWTQSKRRSRANPNPKITFSIGQARQAGLYDEKYRDRTGEPSVWIKYTDDLLLWKCVSREWKRHWKDLMYAMLPVAEDLPGYGEHEVKDVTPRPPQTSAREEGTPEMPAAGAGDPARELVMDPQTGEPEQPTRAPETAQEARSGEQTPDPSGWETTPDSATGTDEPTETEPPAELRCFACDRKIAKNRDPQWVEIDGVKRPYHAKCAPEVPATEPQPGDESEPPPHEDDDAGPPPRSAPAPLPAVPAEPEPKPVQYGFAPDDGPPTIEPQQVKQIEDAIRRMLAQYPQYTPQTIETLYGRAVNLLLRKARPTEASPTLKHFSEILVERLPKVLGYIGRMTVKKNDAGNLVFGLRDQE